jgi:hypothetical protein
MTNMITKKDMDNMIFNDLYNKYKRNKSNRYYTINNFNNKSSNEFDFSKVYNTMIVSTKVNLVIDNNKSNKEFKNLFYKKLKDKHLHLKCNDIYPRFNNCEQFTKDNMFNLQKWGFDNNNINTYFKLYEIIEDILATIDKNKALKKTIVKVDNNKRVYKTLCKTLKVKVWDTYIGKEKGIAKCWCCDNNEIDSKHYECGHIVAKSQGGENCVENLRPICSLCNKSMRTKNMLEFMKENGFTIKE